MATVKVFKAPRDAIKWTKLIEILKETEGEVYFRPEPADISIVLSGRFENPTLLTGKRILFCIPSEWGRYWEEYKLILEAYYDEIHDFAGKNDRQKADMILQYIRGLYGTEK